MVKLHGKKKHFKNIFSYDYKQSLHYDSKIRKCRIKFIRSINKWVYQNSKFSFGYVQGEPENSGILVNC